MDINQVLLEQTLKFVFDFVTYRITEEGDIVFQPIKMHRKQFLKALKGEKIVVKLVDKYPEKIEDNILYVRKDGRTVWYKENDYK